MRSHALIISIVFVACWINIYQFFNVSTYGITPADVSSWLVIFFALYQIAWKGATVQTLPGWAFAGLFFILFAEYASVFAPLLSGSSEMQIQWLKTSTNFLSKWLLILVFASGIYSADAFRTAIRFMLIISIAINIFGIYQIFARAFDLPLAWIPINNVSISIRNYHSMDNMTQLSLRFENFFRATSIFSEPSFYAQFNTLVLTFLLIPFLRGTQPFLQSKLLRACIAIPAIIGMFLTFSLTALFSISLITVWALIFEQSRKKAALLSSIAGGFALILITDAIVSQYVSISVFDLFTKRVGGIVDVLSTGGGRGTSIVGESFFGRLSTIFQGFSIWAEYPITGIGAGCYEYFSKLNPISFSDSLHSGLLAERGTLGFFAYASLFVLLFKKTLHASRDEEFRSHLSPELLTMTSIAPYVMLAHLAFSFSTYYWINWIFWVHHGLIYATLITAQKAAGKPIFTFSPMGIGIEKRYLGIQESSKTP
jgi:hypothetical protein